MEIRMPMWGMGMLEGTVVAWFKGAGDAVEEGEPIAEIEAAKTTEDLTAPATGVLERIVVQEGVTVPVQEVLAILATAASAPPAGPAAEGTEHPGPVPTAAGGLEPEAAPPGGPVAPASGPVRNVVPRARQRAKELGVDLETVTGSGPDGRIVVDDVERAAAAGTTPPPARTTARQEAGSLDRIPLTGMRGTIARRMHQSLQSMAQLTLVTTADVSDVVAHREGQSPRPSYTDYVVRAAALALREHPGLNATIDGDAVVRLPDVHVGVATAVENGLVVPVVRRADRRPLADLAAESARLVAKVRDGSFTTDEVSGSTFSVTSLGGQGIDAFTPIINPPEVAILGVGRIVDQPARGGDDQVVWHQILTLSLTIDHRAVDGAPGAAFLQTVVELLGLPERLV